MVNPSHHTLSTIARMTPSLPQRRRGPKGVIPPLTPNFDLFFQMRVYGHAPRGEGRQTPSARGSITIQYCPLQVFNRAENYRIITSQGYHGGISFLFLRALLLSCSQAYRCSGARQKHRF